MDPSPRRTTQVRIRNDTYRHTFNQALTPTVAALKAESFGVLSDVNFHGAIKEKLGVRMLSIRIAGGYAPKRRSFRRAHFDR